jgi:hypothetical protein
MGGGELMVLFDNGNATLEIINDGSGGMFMSAMGDPTWDVTIEDIQDIIDKLTEVVETVELD